MADFNTELQSMVASVEGVFTTIGKDLIAVLGVAEEELPKIQSLLAVGAGLTALIPGVGGYLVAAEAAVTFVEDLVKTADGVLMKLTEATNIGVAATAVPATDAEKRGKAVDMMAEQFPTVGTVTHDIHIGLAFAKKTKLGAAAQP